jgi:ParB family chromosome partitioning protein
MATKWGSPKISDNVRQSELMDSNNDGYGSTKRLLLDEIDPNPDNFFSVTDESVKELAEDIKREGVLHAILVTPKDNGRYMIISGERRYRASKIAGLTAIPSQIRTFDSALAEQYALIQANMTARTLSDSEKIHAVDELSRIYDAMKTSGQKVEGKITTIIGEKLGMSGSSVKNYQKLNSDLIPEWKALMDNKDFKVTSALVLASFDEDVQRQLFEQLGTNLFLLKDLTKKNSDLETYIKTLDENKAKDVEEKAEEKAKKIVSEKEKEIKFDYEKKLADALDKVTFAEEQSKKFNDDLKASQDQVQELEKKRDDLKTASAENGDNTNNHEIIRLTEELNKLQGTKLKLEKKAADYDDLKKRLEHQAMNANKDILLASFIAVAKSVLDNDAFSTDNKDIIDQVATLIETFNSKLQ